MEQSKKRSPGVTILASIIISICFSMLFWNLIPLDWEIKLPIVLFSLGFLMLVVGMFIEYLAYFFNKPLHMGFILIITTVVFLLFPIIINCICKEHEKKYLVSYPDDGIVTITITCDITYVRGSGSIGNELSVMHYLNNQSFKEGTRLTLGANENFVIKTQVVEQDAGLDDSGEAISSVYNYSTNRNYEKDLIISQRVHVGESGGRKNANAYADFSVIYCLKRVLPSSMNPFLLFFYTKNKGEYFSCLILLAGQIASLVFIGVVLLYGKRKEKSEEEKVKAEKQQAYLEERECFINCLGGRSIRDAALVPPQIVFVNGLPRDNNNTEYGSFTVYYSKNGKCYHDKKGCCSAYHAIHYFQVHGRLKPCAKCCTRTRQIPGWFIDYRNLLNKARHYNIQLHE